MPTQKPKAKNSRVITALVESSFDEDVQVTAPPQTNEPAERPLVHPVDDDDGPATPEAPPDGDAVVPAAVSRGVVILLLGWLRMRRG